MKMNAMAPPPVWMYPLPTNPPTVDAAFKACVNVYHKHTVPSHLCRQCLTEEMEQRIITAVRLAQEGKTPLPEDFGQIYFEHPGCVGGEDTIKLFLPFGIREMLTGKPPEGFGAHSYPEVLETMLKAGFWFWSTDLIAPARALAARLFWDWFRDGRYDWPRIEPSPDDLIGPGYDILPLCIACLIDPADLIAALMTVNTPQGDEALSLAGIFTGESPFYFSYETGTNQPVYKPACDQINASLAAREAQAALKYVTPEWLQAAFWRYEGIHPDFAAYLSDYENYHDVKTVELRERANQPVMINWPDLPRF